MRALADIEQKFEVLRTGGEFTRLVALVGAGGADGMLGALALAESTTAPDRLVRILKAGVAAGSLSDPTWAGALAGGAGTPLVAAFAQSLESISFFDAMLPFTTRAPPQMRVVSVTAAGVGGTHAEGGAKVISRLTLAAGNGLTPLAVYAILITTDEVFRAAAGGTQIFFERELRRAVSNATNAKFASILLAGAGNTLPSAGTDVPAVRADVTAALLAIAPRENSRIFVLMRPEQAIALSMMADSSGPVFPQMSYRGGSLGVDLPALVFDQIPSGLVIFADASAIAAWNGGIALDSSSAAAIELRDDPTGNSVTPSATSLISLFQVNSTALRLERWLAAEVIRSGGIAVLEDVDWATATGSDA